MGWDPEPTGEEGVLRVDFSGEGLPITDAQAIVRFDVERFTFYFNFGDSAPERQRAEVAEFITRVNYGLIVGNFELNLHDGSLRYKSALDFTEAELTKVLVRNAILSSMDSVEHYSGYLLSVVHGDLTARQATDEADAAL
jgi:hypothetical protein